MQTAKHFIRITALMIGICVIAILSPSHTPGHRDTSRDFLLIEPKRPTPRTLQRIQPRTLNRTVVPSMQRADTMSPPRIYSGSAVTVIPHISLDTSFTVKEGIITEKSTGEGKAAYQPRRIEAALYRDNNNGGKVRGQLPIALVWGEQLRVPIHCRRAMIGLAEGIRMYTDIEVSIDSHLMLASPHIHDYPMLIITSDSAFELTQTERDNLRTYLKNGGFLFVDNGQPNFPHSQAEASMKQMFRDVIGSNARPQPLTAEHEIFSSLFDFTDGAPIGMENNLFPVYARETVYHPYTESAQTNEYSYFLDGYYLDGQCVAVYSDRGYTIKWGGINSLNIDSWQWEGFEVGHRAPQLKFGVNLVVYALHRHAPQVPQYDVAKSD